MAAGLNGAPAASAGPDRPPAETALPVAVVVPVLDERENIAAVLASLAGRAAQVVVADGGSQDGTPVLAQAHGAIVITSERGRAIQMNAGAAALAPGWRVVLFLHADTRLPAGWSEAIGQAVRGGAQWGRFDVRLRSEHPLLRLVGAMMNARSRLTGICTGDQAMFVTAPAWHRIGGFPAIELMEDIAISARLKRCAGRPAALRAVVQVSARRWERNGIWRTIGAMWILRLRYFLGEAPPSLHARYYGKPR